MKTKFRLTALLLSAVMFLGFIGCDIPINDQFNVHVSLENKEDEENPASTYSITIDGDLKKGTVTASKTDGIKENELVTLTITPEEGYRVATLTVKNGEEQVLVLNNKTFIMPAGDVKVSVAFIDESSHSNLCTVSFNSDGGSEVESQTVRPGNKIMKPFTPTKKGYTFSAWYNGDTIFDFDSEITEDITLTAKWTSVSGIKIELLPNSAINVKSEETESSIILTADEGYTNYNWCIEGKAASQFPEVVINGNILTITKNDNVILAGVTYQVSLNAIKDNIPYSSGISIKRIIHTVTFEPNNGSASFSITVPDCNKVQNPGNPEHDSQTHKKFIFEGWFTSLQDETPFDFNTPITRSFTLYSKWTALDVYNVIIDNNILHGSVRADKTKDIVPGETVTLTVIVEDEASFGSLTVKSDNTDIIVTNNSFIMPAGDVNISATFNWPYIGLKSPSKVKEVCDIVFKDGSATTYRKGLTLTDEQKAAAIALIFYRGNELNNDGDTTTIRTLGVGLKGETNLVWSSGNAAGYKITTIQNDVKNGSFNLERIGYFLRSSGKEDDTGDASKYSAFYYAKNYKDAVDNLSGTEFESGWYLPTKAEMDKYFEHNNWANCQRIENFQLGFAVTLLNIQALFNNDRYWTSTQEENNKNDAISTYQSVNKRGGHHVIAIREF